ncbi:LysR family transcriptional regulator [Actinoplanes sp. NPDC026619]|uniref:LysR family transcriptional regulator n=1 Tax=Actinoplanes sp. NPDC026619 TaxID=3155798 RepID=UPI0033D93AB6
MKATSIDLNLLTALHALLAERNVTRAGQRVGLSQPAMSEALARLRRHYGDELLIRVGNRYELTPLGAGLLASAAAAMDLVEQTFTAAQDFDPASCEREFVLIASDYAAGRLGPALAGAIRARAPRARLRIAPLGGESSAGQMTTAARGVDGFILPRGVTVDGFPGVTLFQDRWMCLVSADNPVAGGALTVDNLRRMSWVIHHLLEQHSPVLAGFRSYGIEPDVELIVAGFHLLPAAVAGSDRAALVQAGLFGPLGVPAGLRMLELPIPATPVTETLWWHPAHTADPAHRWLRDLAVAAGRSLEDRGQEEETDQASS